MTDEIRKQVDELNIHELIRRIIQCQIEAERLQMDWNKEYPFSRNGINYELKSKDFIVRVVEKDHNIILLHSSWGKIQGYQHHICITGAWILELPEIVQLMENLFLSNKDNELIDEKYWV